MPVEPMTIQLHLVNLQSQERRCLLQTEVATLEDLAKLISSQKSPNPGWFFHAVAPESPHFIRPELN